MSLGFFGLEIWENDEVENNFKEDCVGDALETAPLYFHLAAQTYQLKNLACVLPISANVYPFTGGLPFSSK